MDWNSLAQFSAATLLILVSPGPIMAIIAHNTLRHGTTAGFSTAIGVELGEVCLLGAVVAGLAFSGEFLPSLLRWLSLAGALYLIWLAACALRIGDRSSQHANLSHIPAPLFDGLTISFASPAALLFYAAFFPQFIDPHYSASKQAVLLSAIYICMRAASAIACVLAVARFQRPVHRAQLGRLANLGSAAVYLSIAVITILRLVQS